MQTQYKIRSMYDDVKTLTDDLYSMDRDKSMVMIDVSQQRHTTTLSHFENIVVKVFLPPRRTELSTVKFKEDEQIDIEQQIEKLIQKRISEKDKDCIIVEVQNL